MTARPDRLLSQLERAYTAEAAQLEHAIDTLRGLADKYDRELTEVRRKLDETQRMINERERLQ